MEDIKLIDVEVLKKNFIQHKKNHKTENDTSFHDFLTQLEAMKKTIELTERSIITIEAYAKACDLSFDDALNHMIYEHRKEYGPY